MNLIDASDWTGACSAPVNYELFTTQPVHLGFDGENALVAVVNDPADKSKFHVRRVFPYDSDTLLKFDVRTITYDRWLAHSTLAFKDLIQLLGLKDDQLVPVGLGYKDGNPMVNIFHWHVLGGGIVHGGDELLVEEALRSEYELEPLTKKVKPTKCPPHCMAMLRAVHTATYYEEPTMRTDPEPMTISYDEKKDVVTICGVKYTGEFFRGFNRAEDKWFRVTKREEDGSVTLHQPGPEGQVALDYALQCMELGKRPERVVRDSPVAAAVGRPGEELVNALGLQDQRVCTIELTAESHDIIRVAATMAVSEAQVSEVCNVIKRYKITPIDETAGEANGDQS
jgi:hypothetical protein